MRIDSEGYEDEKLYDVASQSGEDGVIADALAHIGADCDKWCVEFGAWDGKHLSNTYNLIANKDYGGVLIEADPTKFKELSALHAKSEKVHTLNAFVGFEPNDNLDVLLARTPIPKEFDVLSVDIDGNDYHVWDATKAYRPKIVIIEYNPTIPTPVEFVQPKDMAVNQGASLLSLVKLGKEKGYELFAVTRFSACFVDARYFDRFGIADNAPERLRTDNSLVTYIFSGYDGTVFLRGSMRLPWQGRVGYREQDVQVVPRPLRKFPPNYSRRERILWRAFARGRKRGIW
jgi:hypothetical protein